MRIILLLVAAFASSLASSLEICKRCQETFSCLETIQEANFESNLKTCLCSDVSKQVFSHECSLLPCPSYLHSASMLSGLSLATNDSGICSATDSQLANVKLIIQFQQSNVFNQHALTLPSFLMGIFFFFAFIPCVPFLVSLFYLAFVSLFCRKRESIPDMEVAREDDWDKIPEEYLPIYEP